MDLRAHPPSTDGVPTGQPALNELFGVDERELEANRAGRMGSAQARRQRNSALLRAAGTAALTAAIIANAVGGSGLDGVWIVADAFAALVIVVLFATAWSTWNTQRGPVRRLVGPVEPFLVSGGGYSRSMRLRVGERKCLIAGGSRRPRAWWASAFPGPEYVVYVVGRYPTAVAAERAGTRRE